MSGPRDPDEFERSLFLQVVAGKSEEQLRGLMSKYPSVLWGSMTRALGEEDQEWIRQTLRVEPASELNHA